MGSKILAANVHNATQDGKTRSKLQITTAEILIF
jgi:hypothetical protein